MAALINANVWSGGSLVTPQSGEVIFGAEFSRIGMQRLKPNFYDCLNRSLVKPPVHSTIEIALSSRSLYHRDRSMAS